MRLVFASTPAVAVPSLDAIAQSGHELVAVVTRPDAPAGRGRHLVPSPGGACAREAGTLKAAPQPVDGVSMAPKVTVEDAQVRWAEPAFAVDRRIRACTPAPGAWTTFRGERVKLGPVRPTGGASGLGPGEISVGR